jgi:hypothetical protein
MERSHLQQPGERINSSKEFWLKRSPTALNWFVDANVIFCDCAVAI